jgi:hypothetical protein
MKKFKNKKILFILGLCTGLLLSVAWKMYTSVTSEPMEQVDLMDLADVSTVYGEVTEVSEFMDMDVLVVQTESDKQYLVTDKITKDITQGDKVTVFFRGMNPDITPIRFKEIVKVERNMN